MIWLRGVVEVRNVLFIDHHPDLFGKYSLLSVLMICGEFFAIFENQIEHLRLTILFSGDFANAQFRESIEGRFFRFRIYRD